MPKEMKAHSQHLSPTVAKHIRRLGRKCRVRPIAERVSVGVALGDEEVDVLISAVEETSGRYWRDRLVVAACLGECHLTPEQWERATSALRSLVSDRAYLDKRGRFRRGVVRWQFFTWTVLAAVAALAHTLLNSGASSNSWILEVFTATFGVSMLFMLPGLLMSAAREDSTLRQTIEEAIASLGKLADPLSVGVLARLQTGRYGTIAMKAPQAEAAKLALPAALDAVREEHYGLLPADATPALCEALVGAGHNHTMRILRALQAAGTGRGAEPLRRLIADPSQRVDWESAPELLVGSESALSYAEAVLPLLEERFRNETAASRLLRPASQPGEASEILLRPAGSATSVPEEQLLRPSSREDG